MQKDKTQENAPILKQVQHKTENTTKYRKINLQQLEFLKLICSTSVCVRVFSLCRFFPFPKCWICVFRLLKMFFFICLCFVYSRVFCTESCSALRSQDLGGSVKTTAQSNENAPSKYCRQAVRLRHAGRFIYFVFSCCCVRLNINVGQGKVVEMLQLRPESVWFCFWKNGSAFLALLSKFKGTLRYNTNHRKHDRTP